MLHFVISAVWAGTVFGPRLWQLSARRRLLAAYDQQFSQGILDDKNLLHISDDHISIANLTNPQ